jgi:hypothetical protein
MGKVKIVQIEFWDHTCTMDGVDDIYPMVVWGAILDEDERQIHLAQWASVSEDHFDNYNTCAIIKSTIHKIKHLGTYEYQPSKDF